MAEPTMDVTRLVHTQVTSAELDPAPELVQGESASPAFSFHPSSIALLHFVWGKLIQGINSGTIKLLDVVRALGTFLVSEADGTRARGVEYLSNLLAVVDKAQINRSAATTLRGFFLSKLDDMHALPPSLKALGVLAKLGSFGDDEAEEVYRA